MSRLPDVVEPDTATIEELERQFDAAQVAIRRKPSATDPAPTLAALLQRLHDSKISGAITWLFDGVWHVEIGSSPHAAANFRTAAEAVEWLRATAAQLYPDSPFARRRDDAKEA